MRQREKKIDEKVSEIKKQKSGERKINQREKESTDPKITQNSKIT